MGGDKSTSPTALNIPGMASKWDRVITPGAVQNIVATPRPTFPIEAVAQQQQPWAWNNNKAGNTNLDAGTKITAVDKGKGRAIPPLIPTLQRTASAPAPQTKAKANPGASTNTNVNAQAASYLKPTPSSILAPPTRTWERAKAEHKYDPNLPSLAAVESNSRLMRAKIVCATCGEVGPDFPRCGRCSEAWCSRSCRVEANKVSGGKHRCSPSVA
ncbi:hypothetical protein M408DRAFT_329505 [Serendipita vermifera MAFF 305830]|uniref:HIT-type domain-containing protein n=1 Tax=Serendipita vermifera MAFF 305830 TaxID=933852 RepID=A0A0C3BAG6_SERVB|nr:hypothetical protein M408DRAFT_329505 [Serendipita vermifera MAFF 305830]